MPIWLYSHTKAPIAYGYWTSTPITSGGAFLAQYDGGLVNWAGVADAYGIRPVINIKL